MNNNKETWTCIPEDKGFFFSCGHYCSCYTVYSFTKGRGNVNSKSTIQVFKDIEENTLIVNYGSSNFTTERIIIIEMK